MDNFLEKQQKQFTVKPETMQLLTAYDWPGNVRELEKAIEMAESVIALSPQYPIAWLVLGGAYSEQGRFDEAIAAHENLAHLPMWAYALGQTYAWAGQPEKALEIATEYEQKPGRGIALVIIYAALGDVEKTLYWSEQARNNRLPWSIGLFSYFTATRSLLGDPRIRAEAEKYPAPLVPFPKD